MDKPELPDLEVFDEGLDSLQTFLKKVSPYYPTATVFLQNLEEFRAAVAQIDEALGPDLDDKELEEVERALGLLVSLEGHGNNFYAKRALEKVRDAISAPLPAAAI